jgi:hypothetical protein
LGESTPEATTPVPVKLSTIELFIPFEVVAIESLPLKFPPPVGANVIVAEAVFPTCKVSGRLRLLMENPAPLIVA